ncbi:MAG: hypothetical protein RBR59_06560 [Sulfurimonadaceae bacterium]|jgi:hypothetical protein|nr:hypothetical protein [Sulfurimonadaceae bacterium]
MLKKIIITICLHLTLYSDCLPQWLSDENNCKVYNPCPSETESIEWDGKCKNGKIEGQGILKWYVNGKLYSVSLGNMKQGKINEDEFQIDIWDESIFLGYEGTKGFIKGTYLQNAPNKVVYFGSFKVENKFDYGILIDDTSKVAVGSFDEYNQLHGHGLLTKLSSHISENGYFNHGNIEEGLRSEFYPIPNKELCNFSTAYKAKDQIKYKNTYQGICGYRTNLQDNVIQSYHDNIWFARKTQESQKVFLSVRKNSILKGNIINGLLEGEGMIINEDYIETGMFKRNTLVEGWRIYITVGLKNLKYERVK